MHTGRDWPVKLSVCARSLTRNVFRPTFRLEDPTVNQTDKPLPLPVELTLYRAPLLCCGLCFAKKKPWGTLKDYSVLPRLQPQNLGPPPEQSGVLNIWVGTPKRNKWTQKTWTANLRLSAGHVPAWTSLPPALQTSSACRVFSKKSRSYSLVTKSKRMPSGFTLPYANGIF